MRRTWVMDQSPNISSSLDSELLTLAIKPQHFYNSLFQHFIENFVYYQLDARYYIYLFEWNFGVHTAVSMFIFMSVSSSQQSLCPCGQHNWGRALSPLHPRKIQSLDNRVIWHLLQLQWLKDPRALGSISRHISLLSTRSRQRQD